MFDDDIWKHLVTPTTIRGDTHKLFSDTQRDNSKSLIDELNKDSRKHILEDYEQMITTATLIRNILMKDNIASNAVKCFNNEDKSEDRIFQMTKTAQLIKELTILITMFMEEEKLMHERENDN